jgi:polyisoprenoid-binding protein YceI
VRRFASQIPVFKEFSMKKFATISLLTILAGSALVAGGMGRTISTSAATATTSVALSTMQADAPFAIDAVHSAVIFRIKHQGVAFNYGRFNKMSGSFHIDSADPSKSVLDITVDAASVDTANADRDKHLTGNDFFSVKEYPTITFKSTSFTKKSEGVYTVAGKLSFHGKSKDITVEVADTGKGAGMRGGEVAGIESTFTIKRSEFGMDYLLKGLSDDVTLTVALEGTRK